MFQINSMLLIKMGWSDHSSTKYNGPKFNDNDLVKFYIRPDTRINFYIFIRRKTNIKKLI